MLSLREACGNAKMPPNPRSLVLDAGYCGFAPAKTDALKRIVKP